MTAEKVARLSAHVWRWIDRAASIALPGQCAFCMGETPAGQAWCDACFAALPWNRVACRRCAEPLARAAALCGEPGDHRGDVLLRTGGAHLVLLHDVVWAAASTCTGNPDSELGIVCPNFI